MSKYDDERKKMGLQPLGAAPSQTSKYDAYRASHGLQTIDPNFKLPDYNEIKNTIAPQSPINITQNPDLLGKLANNKPITAAAQGVKTGNQLTVSPSGTTGAMAGSNLVRQPEDNRNWIQKTGDFLQNVDVGVQNALTFGLKHKYDEHMTANSNDPGLREFYQDQAKSLDTAGGKTGEFVGDLVGVEKLYGAGKLALKALLPNAGKIAQVTVPGAIAGTLYGAGHEAADLAADTRNNGNESILQRGKNIATDAALFSAGDAALAGLGKGVRMALERLKGRSDAPKALDEILALPEPKALGTANEKVTEPLGLPEPNISPATTARIRTQTNPYRQKYEALIEKANTMNFTPGRELEELESLWSQMADRTDPGLSELIDLAYPATKNRITPDLARRARENQYNREVAGVPLPVRSMSDRYQPKVGTASMPQTVIKRASQPANDLKMTIPDELSAMASNPVPLRNAKEGADVKPITRNELMKNIQKELGVTVRTGRLGKVGNGVLGWHNKKSEIIRSKNHGDIAVISHEIGHNLDKRFNLQSGMPQQEMDNLLSNHAKINQSAYSPEQLKDESIAEYMRLYLTDPDIARQAAPQFTRYFESVTGAMKNNLAKVQDDVARWIDQGEAAQFSGQINRTGKSKQPSVNRKIDNVYSDMVDKFYTLARAEKAIKGGLGDASDSLYKKARLSVGAPKKAEMIMQDLKNALKPLDKFGYKLKDLGDYAAAKHAADLEAQGIESGFTQAQISSVLKKFDTPEMNMMQKRLITYNNNLLDILLDAQILTREAVNAMRKKYPNYVPFYRFFDEDMSFGFSGKGFTDLTSPIKRMKGSTRDIIDPIESMIKNTFAVVNAAEKNKVGLQLAKLADVEGAGKFVEKLDGAQSAPKENIVTVWEKGKKVQYQLDHELYKAMKQLDEDTANLLTRILSYPASTLRAGATLTPEFMLRNPIRDQFQAYVVSNFGYNPIIDLPFGVFHALSSKFGKPTKLYQEWARSGGGYGNYLSQDRNYIREQLKKIRNENHPAIKGTVAITDPRQWLRLLRSMSELSEEATKLGEFRRGIKKGYSVEEAAYQSRDLMDFGRVGSNMRQINRVVAFLNANIQGKDKIARAFKNNPVRTTIRAITGLTLPTIGIYLWNQKGSTQKQRETIDNAPQWLKDTFWLVSVPGTDVVARIPKPFDLAPVFANIPENIAHFLGNDNYKSTGEVAKDTIIDIGNIPYMLTGLTPVIENITNYSFFTGGPIVPRRDQDLLPEDQYGINTSLTARAVGKLAGTSPYKVDNLIRGYGAGLGKYATAGSDAILEKTGFGKLPPQEEKKISEWPVINAFTVDSTGGGQVMTDFYDTLDKFSRQQQSNKKNESIDGAVADKARFMNRASQEISRYRAIYRDVQGSFDMTPQEKRKKLDELDVIMNNIARDALKRVGE